MSESMTVEQARADFETWISKPPFEYSTARFGNGEYVYATVGFAWKAWQAAQSKMQARVAELEAEKWNAQIAETALASVEQERDELRRRVAEMERQNDELAAKLKLVIDCGDSCCDEYCKDEWDLAVNAAADKTLARIKAAAVREAAMQWDSDPAKDYDNVRADLLEYANQIEGGA